MDNVLLRMVAALSCAGLFGLATWKTLGAMQQSGYKNADFLRWLRRKNNLYYNRLCVAALCGVLATAITSLCFSFLGVERALLLSMIPFLGVMFTFCLVDEKYALKVPICVTSRIKRLFAVYLLFVACVTYAGIAILTFLSKVIAVETYALLSYTPFSLLLLALPYLLCLANALEGGFEGAKNEKFVKQAGQVLDETQILRVAVVGSYGKTSVKNILKTLLSEKYTVVETPESYNTPMGIAKTVLSDDFANKQIFIAEMGARRTGDIAQLCALVKPEYAIFTGVCEQHIATFGGIEGVWTAKKEIFDGCKNMVVCGESLREFVEKEQALQEKARFAGEGAVKGSELAATYTQISLFIDKERCVRVPLLGGAAVENILLAVTLCQELGMTAEEIERGLKNLQPIPHRLQLIKNNGVYILDDGYNGNPRGAKESLLALNRFQGRKCVVTPGIIECGVLEEKINEALGKEIAKISPDKVILVGDTLVGAVKNGYLNAHGEEGKLIVVSTLEGGQKLLSDWICRGDAVLFLNDLPDVY